MVKKFNRCERTQHTEGMKNGFGLVGDCGNGLAGGARRDGREALAQPLVGEDREMIEWLCLIVVPMLVISVVLIAFND